MIPTLRADLAELGHDALRGAAAHPGLWYDRYLRQLLTRGERPPDSGAPVPAHIGRVAAMRPAGQAAFYDAAYRRWRAKLTDLEVQPQEMGVQHRLAAGHGGKNATETGLTLHHTYGVPYIPGSSLKGVAAAFAARRLNDLWNEKSEAYRTLFGTTDSAGYITFLDALPKPGEWWLLPDVLTVHHREYYRAAVREPGEAGPPLPPPLPPADWDSPTPVTFLSAQGTFLLALLPAPGAEAWADVAYEIVKLALAEMGVGGKTSSGYGRLTMP